MAATTISDVGDLERAVSNNEVPQVDVFSLVNVIGAGDYCIAFRAHAGNPISMRYAVLFPREPQYNPRIRNKARILQHLDPNPHTTRFIWQGVYRGMPFLVEEYANPLSRFIELGKAGVRWRLDDFTWFAHGLLSAVDYFHRRGYVHGDLHPGNVAIARDMSIKLLDLDFVMSNIVASVQSGHHEGSGFMSGEGSSQYLYAAPEACAGEVRTPSSDIYSAGALSFALLTGRPPKRGEYDVSSLRPDLPWWTTSLLASMIQQNRQRPSAVHVQQWLREYQHHDDIMNNRRRAA